jgi:hypothetical protein
MKNTFNVLTLTMLSFGVLVEGISSKANAAGAGDLSFPTGVVSAPLVTNDNQPISYITDYNNHVIQQISANGSGVPTYSIITGQFGVPGYVDGPLGSALFNFPVGISIYTGPTASLFGGGQTATPGSIIVTDSGNNRQRFIYNSGSSAAPVFTKVFTFGGYGSTGSGPIPGSGIGATGPAGPTGATGPKGPTGGPA